MISSFLDQPTVAEHLTVSQDSGSRQTVWPSWADSQAPLSSAATPPLPAGGT